MSKTLRTSCRLMKKFYFSVVFFFSVHDIFHSPVFQKPFYIFRQEPKVFTEMKIKQNIVWVIAHGSAVLFITLH